MVQKPQNKTVPGFQRISAEQTMTLFVFLHIPVQAPREEHADAKSQKSQDPENDRDRRAITGKCRRRAQQAGADNDRNDNKGPDGISGKTADRIL